MWVNWSFHWWVNAWSLIGVDGLNLYTVCMQANTAHTVNFTQLRDQSYSCLCSLTHALSPRPSRAPIGVSHIAFKLVIWKPSGPILLWTHLARSYVYISRPGHRWFTYWTVVCLVTPYHYQLQCWFIVNWTMKKLRWIKIQIFIHSRKWSSNFLALNV